MKVKTIMTLVHYSALKSLFLLALMLSSACGPEESPDVVTVLGVQNFYHGLQTAPGKALLDLRETMLVSGLVPYGFNREASGKALAGLRADWVNSAWKCVAIVNGKETPATCAGEDFAVSIRVETSNDGCPMDQAYAHEEIHVIHDHFGIYDPEHTRPEWEIQGVRPCWEPRNYAKR